MYRAYVKYKLCVLICYMLVPEILMQLQPKIIRNHSLINAVVDIIKSCHINDESSILIAGDFSPNEMEKLTSSNRLVLTLDHYNLSNYHNVQTAVQALIISPNSKSELAGFLQQVKNSSMWNNVRYNIILNRIISSDSCDKALNNLVTAWKEDLLNSIFLCATTEDITKVYTYNPYTDRAPKPWFFVTKFNNDHNSWYFYSVNYYQDHVTCKTLFFDKTMHLDQYNGFKAITRLTSSAEKFNELSYDIKKRFDFNITKILFEKLNITVYHEYDTHYGTFNEHGNPVGIDKYVADGHYDMLLDYRYLTYTRGLVKSTFILGESGISFIITHRGNVSIMLQILKYFKPIIILFTIIVLGITVAVLKLSEEKSYDTAVIEVIRLFLNGPLLRTPTGVSSRIYLFTVLILILIMQTILQSKILTFILVPQSDDINTFKELADHKEYTIYCKEGFSYLLPPNILTRSIVRRHFGVDINNDKSAFIWEDLINISLAKQRKLHLSKQVLSKHHTIHRTRKSWPLINRVNRIYMRLFENGINHYQMKMAKFHVTKNSVDDHDAQVGFQVALTIQHVEFTFKILIIGFIGSLISFMIEIEVWNFFSTLLRTIKIRNRN